MGVYAQIQGDPECSREAWVYPVFMWLANIKLSGTVDEYEPQVQKSCRFVVKGTREYTNVSGRRWPSGDLRISTLNARTGSNDVFKNGAQPEGQSHADIDLKP